MKVIRSDKPLLDVKKSVLSIGNFDGIHNGHKFLIKKVCERARAQNADSVIITFEPHTKAFIYPDQTPPRLTTFDEKALLLRDFDIDYLICMPFDKHLAAMPPEEFINTVLVDRFKAVEWVMGENHTFGKGKKGNYNLLHESNDKYHISVFTISLHTEDAMVASSTRIRILIGESRIEDAVLMLGHPYPILAERIRGTRKGFKLGYPTLNFRCPPSKKVLPPPGVYAAEVEFNDIKLPGALYFGNCPTFENRDYHFEFHSLGPVKYDPGINTEVALWLYSFIRSDEIFSSESLLIQQIKKDIIAIKKFFSKE